MKNIKNLQASVKDRLQNKAKEKFLLKPLIAINKGEKFDANWKAPGPWK